MGKVLSLLDFSCSLAQPPIIFSWKMKQRRYEIPWRLPLTSGVALLRKRNPLSSIFFSLHSLVTFTRDVRWTCMVELERKRQRTSSSLFPWRFSSNCCREVETRYSKRGPLSVSWSNTIFVFCPMNLSPFLFLSLQSQFRTPRCMRFSKDVRKQSSPGNISNGPSKNFYLSHLLSAANCFSLDSNLLELFNPPFFGINSRKIIYGPWLHPEIL